MKEDKAYFKESFHLPCTKRKGCEELSKNTYCPKETEGIIQLKP
jgi:hypothetical protein